MKQDVRTPRGAAASRRSGAAATPPAASRGHTHGEAPHASRAETDRVIQDMREQHEVALEELRSANEELSALNEEIETSKEEIESANEELRVVNEEMSHRNVQLDRLNSDLLNIQNSTQVGIVLLSKAMQVRHFNTQAERLLNLLPGDVGRPFGHVRHDLEINDLDSWIAAGIENVPRREREVRDRRGRWYSLRLRPYRTPDGTVDGAVLLLVDVDDLKRSEIAIASAREYAESIVDTMRGPLLVLDPGLHVETANRAFYVAFGMRPEETIGRFIYDLGHGQWDIPEFRALLDDILSRSHTIEDYLVERDVEPLGRRRLLFNARRMDGHGGRDARIVLAIEDVTDRLRAEDRVRESEARYRALFDLSPVGVYTCDAAGVIQKFNRTAVELWGRQPAAGDTDERFCGSFRMYRTDGGLLPHPECPMAEIVTGALTEVRDAEVQIERPDRTRVSVVVNIRPLRNAAGEITGAINCFYDITGRKQAEEALRLSDRHKDEFLAMLAHELRNPLAPIRSSIEILRRNRPSHPAPRDPDDHTGYALEVLQRQVHQMVRLVDDLLDAGRISRGKIDLRKERVDLASIMRQVVEAARPLIDGRDQTLTVTLPDVPVPLDADPARLAQIVGNLLNNASKFTERDGRIWLEADRVEATGDDAAARDQPPQLAIRVRDSGIGIAADRLERVFDMFAQGDMSLDRSLSGLGIGLALVRTLTELHGGRVEASSPGAGRGSEFVVRLPIAADAGLPAPVIEAVRPVAAAPLRILIVDDNRDSAETLALLLRLERHEIHTVHDGWAAVEAAVSLDPDVILMDLGLPGLDGYDAARRIREQQDPKRPPMIVALTGYGHDEARRRSEEAGFDAHLIKPIDGDLLDPLLAKAVVTPAVPRRRSPPPPEQRPDRDIDRTQRARTDQAR